MNNFYMKRVLLLSRRLTGVDSTGAVGETVRGETDVSFANYFITADRLRIMDMTRPYYIDYTCFITPKPQPLPQYTAVAWPFHVSGGAEAGTRNG